MIQQKKIHFEVSERKILLRIFDIFSVLFALYLLGRLFEFNYFNISADNFYWTIVLALYLSVFGSVFEMYNLQVASNQYQVMRSIVLTASSTVLVYVLTPMYTLVLRGKRIQIVYFYLAVLGALCAWRMFSLRFLASNQFVKQV